LSARILDGKALSETIRDEVAEGVRRLVSERETTPGLAVLLVGENPASEVYVRNKRSACKAAGMRSVLERLPADADTEAVLAKVDAMNRDPAIHGILVQLPLPPQVDETRVLESIDPRKDVDGFHPENVGLLTIGRPRFVPCTPLGIREMLVRAGIATRGARAVVLGRSNIVGKPMALLLMQKGPGGDATVTVCHTGTADPAAVAREADILVAAMGRPEAVTADWVKPGAVVVDVGIHRREDGTLCGDVHFPGVSEVAGWISPVPGGVGKMTVAMLLQNTLTAARLLGG
jgi:methylenetetrahydrofolate dehydrogenase (NADP+)/methenyltetrahydrofolate cyclohydrolase